MKTTVLKRQTSSYALNQTEMPAGRPEAVRPAPRPAPTQYPGEFERLRREKLFLRVSLAALFAAGALCLPETGLANPDQTPIFTTQPASQTVTAGSAATFTASATGSPTYRWYFAFNGATNLIGTGTSTSIGGYYTNQGNYFCAASNSYGMATSSVVTLAVQYSWTSYSYSSSWQYFSVPYGVTNLAVDAIGAGGGTGGCDASYCGSSGGGRIRFWGVAGVNDSGTVSIGLGNTGGGGGSAVGCSGSGSSGYCVWGGSGGSGGNAGCYGTSGGGAGGGGVSYIGFPSSLSYPDLVLGGAGGGGGGGNNGGSGYGGSSVGGNSPVLTSTSGYYPSPYGGGNGAGSVGNSGNANDGGGGGGGGGGIAATVGGGAFGTGDVRGGGGGGGYSFQPNNVVPPNNSWSSGYYNSSASAAVCAFRPAPLARISMPGASVAILSGQSLSLTAQFFTQDSVNYVYWYRNGSIYASTGITSLGSDAYSSTLYFGTGYSNGDVWTVQVQTSYTSEWGNTVTPIAAGTATTVAVLYPPSISSASQPTNQTVVSGGNASFSVTASGTAPLAYQWLYDSATISGATNTSYSLTGVRASSAGSYTVVVSGPVASVTSSVATLTVNKATPVASTWPTASGITYLQALSASTLTGGSASVGGAFAFTSLSTTPPVGTYAASVTFTPVDTANYNTVVGSVNVAVSKATPVVSAWPAATGIIYGQALSASTLSGGTASAGGTFAFATPGTTPSAGTYYASVIFTPASTASYNAVTGTVAVAVSKAAPSITAWPIASGITYGQRLAASALSSGTATPSGAFAFRTPSSTPSVGTYSAAVTFTPADVSDYGVASGTAQVTVSMATPSVTAWPIASGIVYGQPLAASLLSGGSASTSGSFSFDSPTNTPEAGAYNAAVTFTPADTADYITVSGTVGVSVVQAAQVITLQLQVSNSIPLNQFTNVPVLAMSSSGLLVALSLDTNSVATLDETGTNLVGIGLTGTVTLRADQAGDSNYLAAAEVVATFDVTMMNQTITFSPIPSQITTNLTWPLSATSDSSLPVVFSLVTGPATLDTNSWTVNFTGAGSVVVEALQPGDGTNYNAAPPVMQAIQVSLAQSSLTWSPLPVKTYGEAPFALDGVSSSGDPVTYTSWNTSVAVVETNMVTIVGAGTAVISAQDSGNSFYAPDTASQVLTVSPATPTLTLPLASSINFGQSLASSALSLGSASLGTNAVTGSFVFVDPSTVPNAGTYVASVLFTPDDTADETSILTNVNVAVAQLVPTINGLPLAAPITFGQSLSSSALVNGDASVAGTFAFVNDTSTPGGAGTYTAAVVFTPSDANYSAVSTTVGVEVDKATPSVGSWPTASPINFGNALSTATLIGGSATPSGTFAWTDPSAILDVGNDFVPVFYVPDDTADYNSVNGTVAISVAQGLVEITVMPAAWPITFGQSLASSALNGGNATIGGSFTFGDPTATPSRAGNYTAVVLYTPTNLNYPVLTTNLTVTVNKAAATIVLSGTNQNYDGTSKIVTATTTPPELTVVFTYNGSSTPPVTTGSYTVAATIEDTNYAGTVAGTLLVGKCSLVLAAQAVTRLYGQTNAQFTVVANGLMNGDSLTNLPGTLDFMVEDTNNTVVTVDTNTPAGTYAIIPSGLTSSNYAIAYTNGTLMIAPAILTVTAKSLTNVYGSPMPALTWSYQGFVNEEGTNVLSGVPTLSTNLSSSSPVAGSPYTISITITNSTLSASNYTFAFVDGSFTVLPASLGVSANSVTNVYGSPMPALTGSMAGVTNNDPLTVSFTTVATQSSNVGAYDILPLFNDPSLLANYAVTTNTGTFTVTPAPLLVTADNQTRAYGYANPALTITYSGFAPGDDATKLDAAPTAATSATLTSPRGSYPITVGGGVSGNYTFNYGNGTLTVNQATPVVSVWPGAGGITYPQTLSASALPGGSASVNGSFAFTDPTAILNVGTNLVSVVFTPNDTTNYNTVNGTAAVPVAQGMVEITVLPTPSPITFGQSLASSSFTNGSATVDGNFTFANSSVTPAGAGIYNAAVWFTATDTNYAVFTTNVTVTVNKAAATVSLSGMNQNYDGTSKIVSATTTPNGLTVDLTYNGSNTPPITAGSYAVAATVDDTNYAGTTNGTLLVGKIPLLVAAQNLTNGYGATNAPFSVVANGFTNGETLGTLSGSLTFTIEDTSNNVVSVDTNTPAGTYTIIPGGLTSGNYTISYTNGTLLILPAILTVTANSLTNVYGSPMPALTWSYQGFMNDEGTNVLSGVPSLSTNLSSGSPVAGSPYTISITNGTLSASNYTFAFVDGSFTVLAASLTVSANSVTNVYGSPMPALTGSMAGVTNNDPLTVSFITVATQSSNTGAYDILPLFNDPSLLANYAVTTNTGRFTVTPAPLLVTADNQTRAYGYANPALTITYSGFAPGDDATKLDAAPTAATSATLTSLRGLYPITVGGGVSGNYTFNYGNGTLTVTKAPLHVVGNNASRFYGAANPIFTATVTGVMNNDNITARFYTSASTNSAPGDYIIQLSISDPGGKLGQYNTTLNSGILTVSGASLIGTVQNVSRAYGQTNPVFTVTYSGFVNSQDASLVTGDMIYACTDTNGVNVDTNSPVGTYPIQVASGQTAPNYIIQYTNGTLTVTQAVLTVAANASNRVYGATNPAFTSTITGYVNGEDSNVLSGTLDIASPSDATSQVGTYSIIPSGVSATNYFIDFTNAVLTVTQEPLFVSAANTNRLYGQSNPAFTGSVAGVVNGDNLGITYGTAATPASPVGGYDIVPALADPDNKLGNYLLTANNGTLTVGQTPLSVVAANQTRLYGQSNPMLTGTLTGVVNGDSITASYSTAATAESPVGPYSIVPSLNDPQDKLPNYAVNSSDGTLTVTSALLVVTANDQTRVYGAANPIFTATFSGFVNGETASVLGGTLSVTSPADTTSPAGPYPIIPIGLSATNYSITYSNGTLTVADAILTVTANPATRSYGATNPVFTATISGFLNGDTSNVVSGQAALSTSADSSSPVGTYGIAAAQGNLSAANYAFSFTNGTLTVTPASLTGTVWNIARAYGQTNPVFGVSYRGFVNDQHRGILAGALEYSCLDTNSAAVDTNTPVGVYPIQVVTPQTAANYNIGYVAGTLSVTQAVLTVSADPQSRLYGATNPALTVTYSGFANGEGTNVMSGQPELSTVATNDSPIGDYDIVVELGSLSATNYSFSLTNGTLTVGKALLTVTADNQNRLYGQTNPVFAVQYSGFVDGDTESVVSGAAALSTIADTNTPVGNYDIVATNGNLNATNYALSFVNGTLTINPTSLSITANDASRQYGMENPGFTATMQGFVNGEDSNALAGTLTITTSANKRSNVGAYDIITSGLSSTNYALSFSNGTLTVTQAPLTLTANNTNRIYGHANPRLTGTRSGILYDDKLELSFGTTATASSPAGQYPIFPIIADREDRLGDYLVTTNLATLTVSPALLTVTADDQTRAYGQPDPSLTVHYSGFANGDGPTNLNAQPTASTQADPTYFIGQYPIAVGGGASPNYTFSYVAGTLTVEQANLTIIGQDATRAYGQANPNFTSTITGLANGDNITVSYETLATPASLPGGYDIVLNINDPDGMLGEYNLTLISGTLTISNAALTVTVNNQNRLYGQANPVFTVSYNGFVNGQGTNILTGALTFSCRDLSNAPVGTNTAAGSYPITVAGLTATHYTIQFVPGTLAIGKALLNVTAAGAQRTYGANNPTFTAIISGLVNGETASVLGGTLSVTSSADNNSPTGAYAIIPSGLTSGNYTVNFHNSTLTVTPAPLTGAVASVERAYGQTNPVSSVAYQGFVNSQDSSFVSGPIEFSCLDTNSAVVDTNTPVGLYPIHVITAQTAPNYAVSYVDGTLTITQAVLLVTAENQSRLYGATNQALTVTYSGFLNADGTNVISGQPDLSTPAYDASPVGNYDIVVGLGSLSATNYSFSLTNGTLTVGKVLLTVTADNQVRLYGQTNPAFTFHYSGFVDGNDESVLSGAPALTTVADTNTPVGTYDIVTTNGNLTTTNYALSFVNGTLTINPAPLTITANDATRQYGLTNPAFTVAIQGFVNGENTGALAGTLSLTSSTDPTSNAGAYAIVPAGWTSSNYALSFINGTLTVSQAPLTITASSAVRQYGTLNPVFCGTISGLLNGDSINAYFTCTATQFSPAGTYTIVSSLDDPANYAITLVNGSLTVTVAVIPTTTPGFYVVGSAPVFVDTNASVTDGGNLNFNGGSLGITILTNATADDVLDIEPQGTGAGQIAVQSLHVTYGGTAFAAFSGGQDLNPLVFLFNTNATAESVTALMRRLTFATDNTNTNYRVIQTALTVAGSTVTAQYEFTLDRPPVTSNSVITAAQGATIQFPFSQVLTNDYDVDGDTLTIGDFSDLSANGGWVTSNNLTFTYAPPKGLTGQDRFACIVADGRGGECVGIILINFMPTNSLKINMPAGQSTGAQLIMAGIPNRVYQIQASTNLVDWTTLNTVTADPTGIIELLDAAAINYPHRFYRAEAQ